jgi:hypothetical protein
MSNASTCALCKSHATVEIHSKYFGQTILSGTSWITRGRHWHAGEMASDTLAGIKEKIRKAYA